MEISRLADLYIRPPVDRFGLTQFIAQEALVVIGYNATLDALLEPVDDDERCTAFGVDPARVRGLSQMKRRSGLRAEVTSDGGL